jgi:pyruvate dehydrogenase E1 component alpha subunit
VYAHARRLRTDLRDAVFGAPDMDIDDVFTTVYEEITPGLEAQRRQLHAEMERGA